MAYADYQYYTNTYLGNAIDQKDFDRLAKLASIHIDRITFDRASVNTEFTNEIKEAMCAVAELLNEMEIDGGSGIQSEKVGNLSITYGQNSPKQQSKMKRIFEAAKLYLDNTGLMYRGFASSECLE